MIALRLILLTIEDHKTFTIYIHKERVKWKFEYRQSLCLKQLEICNKYNIQNKLTNKKPNTIQLS